MTSESYQAFEDYYCYPGTFVLRNTLDIRDQAKLEAFEVEISTLRAQEPMPDGDLDPSHYRRIHHHLFQDVYAWAGEYRTIRIAKQDNSFCYPEYIRTQMDALFLKVQGLEAAAVSDQDTFLDLLTPFLSELNAIHPFREGNGRSQLSFFGLLGNTYGHTFHFEKLNRQTYLPAVIASYFGRLQPLREELRHLLAD